MPNIPYLAPYSANTLQHYSWWDLGAWGYPQTHTQCPVWSKVIPPKPSPVSGYIHSSEVIRPHTWLSWFNGKGGRRYCTSFSPLVKWRKKRKKVDIKIAGHLSSFTQSVCQRLFRRHINSSFTLYRVHMTSMSYVCHRMMTERPGRIMYFSHSSQRKQLARLCLKVIEVMKVRTCSLSSLINTLCLVCLLRMKGRVWKQMLWCWGGWARDRFFIRSSNFCGVLAFSLFFFFFFTFNLFFFFFPFFQF